MSKKNIVMEEEPQAPASSGWTSREAYLLALVCLFAGFALGFLFRGSSSPLVTAAGPVTGQTASVPAGMPPATGSGPLHDVQLVEPLAAPLKMAIQANPKNVEALVQLGNIYYDHHVYPEAIDAYRKALELRPNDPNVRTDLGTALWYSGFADQAITEYEKVLAAQPTFAPALMNMGIVKSEGLRDSRGAIAAWEKLLATNPNHPERQRILALMERARGATP